MNCLKCVLKKQREWVCPLDVKVCCVTRGWVDSPNSFFIFLVSFNLIGLSSQGFARMTDLQNGLIANIEAALDSRRMMNVFTSFVTILREQQAKIEDLSKRIASSKDNTAATASFPTSLDDNSTMSTELLARIDELEKIAANMNNLEKRVNDFDEMENKIDEICENKLNELLAAHALKIFDQPSAVKESLEEKNQNSESQGIPTLEIPEITSESRPKSSERRKQEGLMSSKPSSPVTALSVPPSRPTSTSGRPSRKTSFKEEVTVLNNAESNKKQNDDDSIIGMIIPIDSPVIAREENKENSHNVFLELEKIEKLIEEENERMESARSLILDPIVPSDSISKTFSKPAPIPASVDSFSASAAALVLPKQPSSFFPPSANVTNNILEVISSKYPFLDGENFPKLVSHAAYFLDLLSVLTENGGNPTLSSLLSAFSSGTVLTKESFSNDPAFLSSFSASLYSSHLEPEFTKIYNELSLCSTKVQDLKNSSFTKAELTSMLKSSSSESNKNNDPNHIKLVNLIRQTNSSSGEKLRGEVEDKLEKLKSELTVELSLVKEENRNFSSSAAMLALRGNGNSAAASSSSTRKDTGGGIQSSEEMIKTIKEEIQKSTSDVRFKVHHIEETLLKIKDQIHHLDVHQNDYLTEISKLEKLRLHESEQLKLLHKRLATLSVDKVSPSRLVRSPVISYPFLFFFSLHLASSFLFLSYWMI
jgi:CRISPR/Cas system-associated endonuclease Cas3-HD